MNSSSSFMRWSVLILSAPVLFYLLLITGLEWSVYRATGHIVYPIDDPYIHLAMARHLAEDGWLGVSNAGFSASSSAPGWTLLLGSAFIVFGNQEWLPLAFTVLAGLFLMLFFVWWFRRNTVHPFSAAAWAVVLMLILPLPALVALGMEHVSQIVLVCVLAARAAWILKDELWEKLDWPVLLLAFLAVLFRYESLFVVLPLVVMFFARGRWKFSFLLLLSGAAPIVLFGLLNLYNEWHFFPNSIISKSLLQSGGVSMLSNAGYRLFGQLFCSGHLVVPFMLVLAAFFDCLRKERAFSSEEGILGFTFLVASVLHCATASVGWFYRYEAYLLALAAMALAPWITRAAQAFHAAWTYSGIHNERDLSRFCVLTIPALIPLVFFANLRSIEKIVPGAKNIYDQQYQMGLFLRAHYPDSVVTANDIGTVNYLANLYCMDLMGLGSMEPLRAGDLKRWNANFIEAWCRERGGKIAVVYESWFEGMIPSSWIKVGEWEVPDKITVAETKVTFFATSPSESERLLQNLEVYKAKLPSNVTVRLAIRSSKPPPDSMP